MHLLLHWPLAPFWLHPECWPFLICPGPPEPEQHGGLACIPESSLLSLYIQP